MPLVLESPTVCRLPRAWLGSSIEQRLRDKLGYEDLRATHEWRRLRGIAKLHDAHKQSPERVKCPWFVTENGREELDRQVQAAFDDRMKVALFSDEKGLWTYSGLAKRIAAEYGETVEVAYRRPPFKPIGWESPPKFAPRHYQASSVQKLLAIGHGGVELATGLGKSYIIALLCKNVGLPALVVAPSLNIANQLLEDLRTLFGPGRVGQFFDGKKDIRKHITVAVSASLLKVDPESPTGQFLQAKQLLIGDESHLLPAESLSRVILGLLAGIPYRFFLSGTQIRNDGLDIVLDGIVGDIVERMNVRQGVDGGFLSRPRFFQFAVQSTSKFYSSDVIKMNRHHLQENVLVYQHAGKMIDWAVRQGRKVVVLIDQLEQYNLLLKSGKLKLPHRFAHGGMDKETRANYPEAVHKSDPQALVKAFDLGEYPVLIGTSCIGVGTDIRSASFIVDVVGLTSEIRVRQNVGRGTRLFDGKTDCLYCDYDVWNVEKMHDHAAERAKIFEDIYGPVKYQSVN
jgi:superfamily II DNA or RNA helicase